MGFNILDNNENTSSETKHLQSEIINQKKQFIFKVEQTSDFVFPNEQYKYYIYLKNISGVDINNIHILINNPSIININESEEEVVEVGTLKNGEVELIYLKASCSETGLYYTHFICYGDGTGLFNKTLPINCSYDNISNNITHRIHIYNFSPYEETFKMETGDFSNQVTQLFKKQKLPYKAGAQPFNMVAHDPEETINSFNNIESESFINQFDEAQFDEENRYLAFLNNQDASPKIYNNDEHGYFYIGRENFNENSIESFEGKNLNEIINKINNNSQYFKATFLKTGTNELLNDFKQYDPNGFIYRFGLLSSEIYHHVGVLPSYSYMSDYLFRWAPSKNQPLNLIPQKRAFNWNEKKWSGHGYRVYRIATDEYIATDDWQRDFEEGRVLKWSIVEDFEDLKSAEDFIKRQKHCDSIEKAQLSLEYDKYSYLIRESFYDNGVFYVNIPINKIPSNFYLLNIEEIEAIIQRSKPFGVKPLIRYVIESDFVYDTEFIHYPIFKPYTEIDTGGMEDISYFIQTKKYENIVEEICGEEISTTKLMPFGRTINYNSPFDESILFSKENIYPRVVFTNPKNEYSLIYKKFKLPKNNKDTPDNNFDADITQETSVIQTNIDNSLSTLNDIINVLYQNNNDNIGFKMISKIYQHPHMSNNASLQNNNFVTNWAKNNNYKAYNFPVEEDTSQHKGYILTNEQYSHKYNIFKIPIINKNIFNQGESEIGIGIIDDIGKYHYLSAQHNKNYAAEYIKYSTSFNNKYVNKKDGFCEISGLVLYVKNIGFKKIVICFLETTSNELHYFHHIVVSNISDIFIFMSENLSNEDINNHFSCDLISNTNITFELPYVKEYNIYNPYIITKGDNWNNLYRIDREENSYTYIQNKSNESLDVDDIILHFDNINIPDNAVIENVELKTLMNASAASQIYCKCYNQGNNNFDEADGTTISYEPSSLECYPQARESQVYYQNQLNIAKENDNSILIDKYNNLITKNILFNENINLEVGDFIENQNDYIEVSHPFWLEFSDFTYGNFEYNNIEEIEFVIEGFNDGPEVNIISQLLCDNNAADRVETKINSGYFYNKIKMPFINSFNLYSTRIRYKFKDLCDTVKIFNTFINVTFKNKTKQYEGYIETDSRNIKNKEIINLNCLIDNTTPNRINNGLTVKLEFDNLSPGDFYRIYFAELDIVYKNTDFNVLINKDKFFYKEYENNYSVVSGNQDGGYLSGLFYNDTPSFTQPESNININNHGLELKESIYQSFIALSDNITGIEIYPNGFVGSPDSTIKIGLYKNHGNTPGRLIKEIYANGWTKSNNELKDLYSIKYSFNIDNLNIGETYWVKFEVETPNENSYYLLRYTTQKQNDLKLLLKEHNDYINTFGSLEFTIYSKNLSKSFSQLPAVQDYFNNPYIMIGLHKDGEINNLNVKKV